jgi:hypothetical protein
MAKIQAPFKAEYAKSDRSNCRHCQVFIAKDTLRFAELVKVRRCRARISACSLDAAPVDAETRVVQ